MPEVSVMKNSRPNYKGFKKKKTNKERYWLIIYQVGRGENFSALFKKKMQPPT